MRILIISALLLITSHTLFSQRSSKMKKEKPLFFVDLGAFYKGGQTELDRFGGSRFKPDIISAKYLSIGKMKIIRTKTIKERRRRETIELKQPMIIVGSITGMYGNSSNLIDTEPRFNWKGFRDSQSAILCQFKIGRQLMGNMNKSLFWLISPSISYSIYKTQDFNYPAPIEISITDWTLGIGAELNFWQRISDRLSIKIGLEINPTGFVYQSEYYNTPWLQEQQRTESELIVKSVPRIFQLKAGMALNK